jgi:hypothetical protein
MGRFKKKWLGMCNMKIFLEAMIPLMFAIGLGMVSGQFLENLGAKAELAKVCSICKEIFDEQNR